MDATNELWLPSINLTSSNVPFSSTSPIIQASPVSALFGIKSFVIHEMVGEHHHKRVCCDFSMVALLTSVIF